MRRALLLVLLLLSLQSLTAQGRSVLRGTAFPENPKEDSWFYREDTKTLCFWGKGKWTEMEEKPYSEITTCVDYLFAVNDSVTDVYYANFGLLLLHGAKGVFCNDSLEGIWSQSLLLFQDAHKNLIAFKTTFYDDCVPEFQVQQQVKGMQAFCVPETFAEDYKYDCKSIRTWGILGSNAKWLIPPVYDQPFQFEFGVADVVRFGRKFRINELGQEVK